MKLLTRQVITKLKEIDMQADGLDDTLDEVIVGEKLDLLMFEKSCRQPPQLTSKLFLIQTIMKLDASVGLCNYEKIARPFFAFYSTCRPSRHGFPHSNHRSPSSNVY